MEILYVYHLKEIDNAFVLINACSLMHIRLVEIDDSSIHLKLKDIINGKGKKKKNKSLDEPMLIFSGFNSQRIDLFLDALKRGNVPFIPLKAMVTASNINWTIIQLHAHLLKEFQNVKKL